MASDPQNVYFSTTGKPQSQPLKKHNSPSNIVTVQAGRSHQSSKMKSTQVILSLLCALGTTTAQSGQSPDEIQCLARCEADSTCQSVFTNANTGECQNHDCRFSKKPEVKGWTYAEATKSDPKTCADSVALPGELTVTVTGGPAAPTNGTVNLTPLATGTTTTGAPAGPTNAAPALAGVAAGAAAWAVGGSFCALFV